MKKYLMRNNDEKFFLTATNGNRESYRKNRSECNVLRSRYQMIEADVAEYFPQRHNTFDLRYNLIIPLCSSHLSKCAELHDDPDWIVCDYSHQLHNMGVIKLTHGHCKEGVTKLKGQEICKFYNLNKDWDFKNLQASCKNFSLTLSDVEFLHVFTATDKAGFSYTHKVK